MFVKLPNQAEHGYSYVHVDLAAITTIWVRKELVYSELPKRILKRQSMVVQGTCKFYVMACGTAMQPQTLNGPFPSMEMAQHDADLWMKRVTEAKG